MDASSFSRASESSAAEEGARAAAEPHDPALQALVEALPVAACVILPGRGTARPLVRNQAFARLVHGLTGARVPPEIAAAAHEHVAGGARDRRFAWAEPGVAGRHFEVSLSTLEPDRRFGRRTLLVLLDRTKEVDTERSLRFQMLHDSLTGLPNRLAFAEAVEEAMERRGPCSGFAIISLNLTRFSRVNESIGALAGDELIITVARRLISTLRAGDMLARISGDEFAVLVHNATRPADALEVARRLQAALAAPLRLSELEIAIDCAVGCALGAGATVNSGELMRNAQFAMKRAKTSRQVEIYRAGEAHHARRRFSLETELRRAIDADEVTLAFQPLVELNRDRVTGFEVLARWEHPERGPVSPAEFITVAEESGLIVPLGRHVLDRALATLAGWDAAAGRALPIYLGVNVSPVQLARDDMAGVVADALRRHGIDGGRLTLELTESSIIADPDRAAGVLDALHALSCRIAMDDFGTGYSNLALLQRLPIDILKIDRGFVSAMFDDRDMTAIIRAILSLATAFGMATIAEGIETEQAARTLAALGTEVGQGYHYARPMAAEQAFAYLLAGDSVARRPAA